MTSAENDRQQLSRRLTIALAAPVVLLLTLGAVLGIQLIRMSEDAAWVDHTDEVIAVANDAMKQVIDQETGLRGYLITGDRVFLEPYERANPTERLARLRSLVSDNTEQAVRVGEAQVKHAKWLMGVSHVVASGQDLTPARAVPSMLERKRMMDDLRETMRAILKVEEDLRRTRVEASAASTHATKISFVGLILGAAAILAFLSRRQLSAVAETYGKALANEKGTRIAMENEAWTRSGQALMAQALQGDWTVR